MDPGLLFFLVVGAGVLVAVGLGWWFSAEQKARRLLAAHPIRPIGELRPGELARVAGTVRVLGDTVGPLTRVSCAAYHVKIEEKHGKNSWRMQAEDQHAEPFDAEDGTGTLHVDPRGSKLFLTFDGEGRTGMFDNPSPAEAELLERYGVASTSLLGFNRVLRFQEALLSDGEHVTILGRVEIVEVGGAPVLTLVPDAEHGLVVTDRPV